MSTRRRFLLLAVLGLVVLAGCSGGVNQGPPEPETTGGQTTATLEAPNGTLEVHFINVGQSVSTLVVGPSGETMLVDTGHFRDDGEHVLTYLQRHDVERIDYLVVSHNDADHIGGNARIIEYFETEADGIGAVYDPGIAASTQTYEGYLDAVEAHDVTLYETRAGDEIPFEGVDVTVMGPPEPYLENEARNENSIVLKLQFGATSFLLTGDAEDDQEAHLVDAYGDRLNVTVLKAGHHGSASSTGERLLDAAAPQAVVISSGWDNQYGHPSAATLDRIAARDVPTYWTATHGDVVLTSDGERVAVATQQPAPTDPARLREGDPIDPGSTAPVERRAVIAGSGELTAPSATATETVTDGGADPSALEVAEIHADAEGTESENLNDEYVVFENAGDAALDLGGWTVEDEVGKTYTFPEGFTLDAGATVTLHTGSGTDTGADLYWGRDSPVWNNDGDTVVVTTDTGEEVLRVSY
ncbi:lamin tail domain-containing protein [Haloparvum sp. PAK95]|uniref:lamin tail domain-containing protein n=1 Tax=Haloparvum sp. PAK95 TaxID=3418962 RepID=UPI003D2ED57B